VLTALYVSRAAVGWAVVVSRWPLLRRPGSPRAFWVCMLCATAGATLQVVGVYQGFVTALGDSRLASAVLLSLGLCSAAAIRTVLVTFSGRPAVAARWDWLAAGLAWVVMVVPLVGGPKPATSLACVGTCGFVDHTWRSWLHWAPVLAYMGWSFTSACVFCWRHGTRSGRPAVRTGLWLVGLGSALALVWVGLRVAVLATWHEGLLGPRLQSDDDWAEALLWLASMGAVGVGAVWEPLGEQARALGEWLGALRSLWRLRGLWRALIALHPDVRLVGTTWALRPVRLRLVRCVVEIRDCLREIELKGSPEVLASIERHVAGCGVAPGPDADALVTAAMVRWSVAAGGRSGGGGCRLPAGNARDLGSDATWLEQVARFLTGRGSHLTQAALAAANVEVPA
jgi:hypothetical protein